MNQNMSAADQSGDVSLELYKVAFERLTFQDDYLFKFSTVFLTAHGALAVLAGTALFGESGPSYPPVAIVSLVGAFLSVVWSLWTHHNDYWHSVWTGTLREIEGQLDTKARVFSAKHSDIAAKGGRSGRFVPRGHIVAQFIPVGFLLAWFVSFCWALYK